MKILEKFFSIKNSEIHKIYTILGIKFGVYSPKLHINCLEEKLKTLFRYEVYAKSQINKDLVGIQIEKFKKHGKFGLNQTEERTPKITVSLTTFPERIGDVHYAVFSLLNQTVKPDRIVLWLAEEQFPDKDDDLSQKLIEFKDYGLTIKYTTDIRSYKKSIPSLKEFKDDIIVTADDDIYYEQDWLEKLYNEYKQNPKSIYAHLVYRVNLDKKNNQIAPFKSWEKCIDDESVSFLNFPMTGGGVLFPPNSLYKDVVNEDLFKKISPNSDENWFWAMAVLNRTPIKIVKDPIYKYKKVNALRDACFGNEITLARENIVSNRKDIYLKNISDYYPQLLKILLEENIK